MLRSNKNKVVKKIKSLDMFGQSPGFNIDGASSKGSFMGALLSFGVIVLALSYGIRQA